MGGLLHLVQRGEDWAGGGPAQYTHTTLFTKAWQIQNIEISVRKEKKYIYIYTNKK